MADQTQLERLRQSVEDWNTWRRLHPETQPYLRGADLEGTILRGADLRGVDLEGAILTASDLSQTDLRDAIVTDAWLSTSDMSGARLNHAVLRHTTLNNATLSLADLSEAFLQAAMLKSSTLRGASLVRADLSEADLSEADLSEADLSEADLWYVNLRGANLRGANLRGANLCGTVLKDADMREVDVTYARVGWTSWTNLDLRAIRGLHTLVHIAPSTIGIDTLYRSQGQLPEEFLRQAGVPEDLLTHLPLLINPAHEYFRCFVCFSETDEEVGKRLSAALRASGISCWPCKVNFKPFPDYEPDGDRLFRSIGLADRIILLLSEQALANDRMGFIVSMALHQEQQSRSQVLFPIRLDNAIMDTTTFERRIGWSATLRNTWPITDFTHWRDPDAYQQTIEQLLDDLRMSRPQPPRT